MRQQMSKHLDPRARRRQIAENTARLGAMCQRFKEIIRNERWAEYWTARETVFAFFDQLAFPGGLCQGKQRLKQQQPDAIEDAICFLEVDPWFHRSGYIKERFLHWLKRCPLTAEQQERLARCALRSVDGGSRRVFHYYARLAGCLRSPDLLQAVSSRLHSGNPEVVRRANHVFTVIRSRSTSRRENRPGG